MASKGAKHIIALSRSGAASGPAADVVKELSAQGVTVTTPRCDATSMDNLSTTLKDSMETMPPIRGCINAAMVLNVCCAAPIISLGPFRSRLSQDSLFDNMSLSSWQQTVNSKTLTSWNLHTLLPNVDFFIMLASVSGIIGNAGQANYAAGCTFQDQLARHRVSNGQQGLSVDLGAMKNIGVIAESKFLQENMADSLKGLQVEESELLALFNVCCDPAYKVTSVDESQVTLGMETPADRLSKSLEVPESLRRPLYMYFSDRHNGSGESAHSTNYAALFRQMESLEDRIGVVVEALSKKLARAVSMSPEDVEADQPLHAFGVDSLVAVEIRSWISKEFAADIPVSELTGGRSISSIGELVSKASQVQKGQPV
jgi:acyl carrier protein